MRNKLSLILLNLTFALFIFSSCQKEGAEGPEGPQGPTGPTGAQGPQGPQGPAGTANVIYSDWLDVTFDGGVATISAPKLTKDILNSGAIRAYWNLGNADDPFVVSLPAVVPALLLFNEDDLPENPADIYVDVYFSENAVTLVSNYDVSSQQGFSQFRYVIIPGGEVALKSANIDLNNYKQVQQYLKLKN